MKRRFNDNTRLYCHSLPKRTSSNQHKDDSIITETTETIPPPINNENDKLENENDQVTLVKTETS